MPGVEFIQTLLQQATTRGSRSTAMTPLGWLLVIVLSTLSVLAWEHAPVWLVATLAILAALDVLIYLAAYLFFMVKNPDALRSERFTLTKMQIEKSQIGDSLYGFAEIDATRSSPLLAPVNEKSHAD